MNKLLEWELNWVDNHSKRYDNPETVKLNIAVRYLNKAESELQELKEKLNDA